MQCIHRLNRSHGGDSPFSSISVKPKILIRILILTYQEIIEVWEKKEIIFNHRKRIKSLTVFFKKRRTARILLTPLLLNVIFTFCQPIPGALSIQC